MKWNIYSVGGIVTKCRDIMIQSASDNKSDRHKQSNATAIDNPTSAPKKPLESEADPR